MPIVLMVSKSYEGEQDHRQGFEIAKKNPPSRQFQPPRCHRDALRYELQRPRTFWSAASGTKSELQAAEKTVWSAVHFPPEVIRTAHRFSPTKTYNLHPIQSEL